MTLLRIFEEMRVLEEELAKHGGRRIPTELRPESAAANEQDHRAETDRVVRGYISTDMLTGMNPWTFHFLQWRLQHAIFVVSGLLVLPEDLAVYRTAEREEWLEALLITLWHRAGAQYYVYYMGRGFQAGLSPKE